MSESPVGPESDRARSRLDQISTIAETSIEGQPVMVHGSLAHTAVRGAPLPPELKKNNEVRDIDVFTRGQTGKLAVEAALDDLGLILPCPLDAGLCGLLIHDSGDNLAVHKDGIIVEIDDPEGVFSQTAEYEIVGSDGLTLRSFTPVGLLAVHNLEPYGRVSHRKPDMLFEIWCEEQGITLPGPVNDSIANFHKTYKQKYPYGTALRYAADIYTTILPEHIRSRFRLLSHAVMKKHAGRENPFEQDQ